MIGVVPGSRARTATTAIILGAMVALPQLLWAVPGPSEADRELLSRWAGETGVQTAPPPPSLREYAAMATEDVVHRVFGWIHLPKLVAGGVGAVLLAVGYAVALLLLAGALFLIARFLVAAFNRRRGSAGPAGLGVSASPVSPDPPSGAAYWWRRFRAALTRGDTATAMESLWFWVAIRLAGTTVDPSWTSRELLDRVERDDLRPAMTQLDGWRFGPTTPTPETLDGLAIRLGEVLG